MRKVYKRIAPEWIASMVRRTRQIFSPLQRHLARVPGFHTIWILSQRSRFKLIPPRTLNEKIRYRMANDRRDILVQTTDKLAMREYVRKQIGSQHLTVLYSAYECAADITFEDLPRSYVMKATHASGATLLVDERAPSDSRMPAWDEQHPFPFLARVHPDSVKEDEVRRLAACWLQNPYGGIRMRPQWAYQQLTSRVLFEELLDDGDGNSPPDYKFLCFNGEPTVIQVFTEREHNLQRALFTSEWQQISERHKEETPNIEAPQLLPEMISLSHNLAREFDFVRVDLYAVGNRVIVGELTHYPAAGAVIGGGRGILSSAASGWSPNTTLKRPGDGGHSSP